jgi:hypothetical protein
MLLHLCESTPIFVEVTGSDWMRIHPLAREFLLRPFRAAARSRTPGVVRTRQPLAGRRADVRGGRATRAQRRPGAIGLRPGRALHVRADPARTDGARAGMARAPAGDRGDAAPAAAPGRGLGAGAGWTP